ncbi:MAG: hypothetical protein KBA15_10875 [Spirochaetes bacterium]|jgi:chemotaxis regulatin CheY-phosphate phosphatase CheZ|nr:hypothetical protein [Spirochaetota bacterium]
MFRKIVCFLFLTALVFQGGCGTGKYADIKIVIRDMIDARERFVAEAEQAESADEAALSITTLENDMKKLKPRYKELETKYPELLHPEDLPIELKELVVALNRASESRDEALTDILMRYPDDPGVQKAVSSMGDVYK